MAVKKNCRICGKEFIAKWDKIVCCSSKCSEKNRKNTMREYGKEYRKTHKGAVSRVTVNCACCGKPFEKLTTNRKKIYCSNECNLFMQAQRQKLQSERPQTEKKPQKPKNPDDNLAKDVYECEQLNKERKERGERALSYGYYKAYQRQGVIK